jgi:hypothetical protein
VLGLVVVGVVVCLLEYPYISQYLTRLATNTASLVGEEIFTGT